MGSQAWKENGRTSQKKNTKSKKLAEQLQSPCLQPKPNARTHSVLPAEVIDGAHIRALHLFESSLILNQQSGTGSGVPETNKREYSQSFGWYYCQSFFTENINNQVQLTH